MKILYRRLVPTIILLSCIDAYSAGMERVDQDEKRAAIWMRAVRRTRTAGRA